MNTQGMLLKNEKLIKKFYSVFLTNKRIIGIEQRKILTIPVPASISEIRLDKLDSIRYYTKGNTILKTLMGLLFWLCGLSVLFVWVLPRVFWIFGSKWLFELVTGFFKFLPFDPILLPVYLYAAGLLIFIIFMLLSHYSIDFNSASLSISTGKISGAEPLLKFFLNLALSQADLLLLPFRLAYRLLTKKEFSLAKKCGLPEPSAVEFVKLVRETEDKFGREEMTIKQKKKVQ